MEIEVREMRLKQLAEELEQVYSKLSSLKEDLEAQHVSIRRNWEDAAVEEFTAKYDKGMESIWDLLVMVDNTESLFEEAAAAYTAADREVASLE